MLVHTQISRPIELFTALENTALNKHMPLGLSCCSLTPLWSVVPLTNSVFKLELSASLLGTLWRSVPIHLRTLFQQSLLHEFLKVVLISWNTTPLNISNSIQSSWDLPWQLFPQKDGLDAPPFHSLTSYVYLHQNLTTLLLNVYSITAYKF